MSDIPEEKKVWHCSFCARPSNQVALIIAGPGSVCICDECAEQAFRVILERFREAPVVHLNVEREA